MTWVIVRAALFVVAGQALALWQNWPQGPAFLASAVAFFLVELGLFLDQQRRPGR